MRDNINFSATCDIKLDNVTLQGNGCFFNVTNLCTSNSKLFYTAVLEELYQQRKALPQAQQAQLDTFFKLSDIDTACNNSGSTGITNSTISIGTLNINCRDNTTITLINSGDIETDCRLNKLTELFTSSNRALQTQQDSISIWDPSFLYLIIAIIFLLIGVLLIARLYTTHVIYKTELIYDKISSEKIFKKLNIHSIAESVDYYNIEKKLAFGVFHNVHSGGSIISRTD